MLHDQPLMDNASMRESQGAEGALVAEALEKSLLLPTDMAELRNMSGVEVVLDLKKYLGMAIQALFRLGEEVDDHSNALAQERDKFLEAANTLKRSEADLKKATEDLEEMTKARDTAVSDLAVARKQAEDQTNRLQDVEGQLQTAKENITYMKGKLTAAIHEKGVAEYARDEAVRAKDEAVFAKIDAERSVEQAEENAFADGVAKTEATLRAQVPAVCRHYCSQTWHEALNQAGVDVSSDLRREDRVYYPIAIREVAPAAPEEGSSLPAVESHDKTAEDTPLTDQPSEEVEPQRALGEVIPEGQGIPQDVASPPADLSRPSP
ncbi:uncharacterized protein LOC136068188 [Quercus suber]|uniref:uncharacterized protein LOC136068188 n=1 Tax=Quercus suber TaxID=58331 RepID=UPI0032DFF4D1